MLDVRAEPSRQLGRVRPDDPAAEDGDLGRGHAGHAREQDPPAFLRPFEELGPFLDAHPAGDLAHRREQGQGPLGVADRLVGDGGDPAESITALRQLLVGREVEVGEQESGRASCGATPAACGSFTLTIRSALASRSTRRPATIVAPAASYWASLIPLPRPPAGLHQDGVTRRRQLLGPHRQHRDPILVRLDLFRDPNDHRPDSTNRRPSDKTKHHSSRLSPRDQADARSRHARCRANGFRRPVGPAKGANRRRTASGHSLRRRRIRRSRGLPVSSTGALRASADPHRATIGRPEPRRPLQLGQMRRPRRLAVEAEPTPTIRTHRDTRLERRRCETGHGLGQGRSASASTRRNSFNA